MILLSAEDDPSDTIRPRLDAAGANVSRVHILTAIRSATGGDTAGERSFDLTRDLHRLERAIGKVTDCRLIVIDPISAYLGGTESHKNADVRAVLAPLAALAARAGAAVVAVSHLRKGDGKAIYRTMGSIAFVAAARGAWAVSADLDDPSRKRRLFTPLKNNLAVDVGGLAFELAPSVKSACLAWDSSPVTISADEALSPRPDDSRSAVDDAVEWLRDELKNGPVESKYLNAKASEEGISTPTLKRARSRLGVKAEQCRDGDTIGKWISRLPEHTKGIKNTLLANNDTLDIVDTLDTLALEPNNQGYQGYQGYQGDQEYQGDHGANHGR